MTWSALNRASTIGSFLVALILGYNQWRIWQAHGESYLESVVLPVVFIAGLVIAGWFHLKAAQTQSQASQPPQTKRQDDQIAELNKQILQRDVSIRQLKRDLEDLNARMAAQRTGDTPNLVFGVRGKSWSLSNIGEHSVLIEKVIMQRTAGDWGPQGPPIALDPLGHLGQGVTRLRRDWFISDWKKIIRPSETSELRWELGKAGRYIYTFTFLYGSTGQTRHELLVHLNVDGSDNAIVFGQKIRLAGKA